MWHFCCLINQTFVNLSSNIKKLLPSWCFHLCSKSKLSEVSAGLMLAVVVWSTRQSLSVIISPRCFTAPSAGPQWQSTAVTHSEQVPQWHSAMSGRLRGAAECSLCVAVKMKQREKIEGGGGIKCSPAPATERFTNSASTRVLQLILHRWTCFLEFRPIRIKSLTQLGEKRFYCLDSARVVNILSSHRSLLKYLFLSVVIKNCTNGW